MAINKVKLSSDIELKDRLVAINRVTKVTKGGRTFTFSAIVVVGNENGIIGWGLGKAGEVTAAIAKGVEAAKKKFACGATISVSGYSATGDSLGGAPFQSKRFAQIQVDTSDMA